jgi:hypothetical protein
MIAQWADFGSYERLHFGSVIVKNANCHQAHSCAGKTRRELEGCHWEAQQIVSHVERPIAESMK